MEYKTRTFDKIFFSFPLCLLGFSKDNNVTMNLILIYCLANNQLNKESFYSIRIPDEQPKKYQINEFNDSILSLKKDLKLRIDIESDYFNVFLESNKHIEDHEKKYGSLPYCRVGKQLFLETYKNQFNFVLFQIYCAISSVIGSYKKATRITKERIKYRMLGYKDKNSFISSGNEFFISNKQLDRLINILRSKLLITKFTYMNRQTYYSLIIKEEEDLAKYIEREKDNKLKYKSGIVQRKSSKNIKDKLSQRMEVIKAFKEDLKSSPTLFQHEANM